MCHGALGILPGFAVGEDEDVSPGAEHLQAVLLWLGEAGLLLPALFLLRVLRALGGGSCVGEGAELS